MGVAPVAAVMLGVAAGRLLESWLPPLSPSLLFILPVLACAAAFGVSSGLVTAVLSFFAFNFFFVEPRYTFTVSEPQAAVALAVFLLVAGFTGVLAGRMREQARAAEERAEALQRLYDYSGDLSSAKSRADIWDAVVAHATAMIEGEAVLCVPEGETVRVVSSKPEGLELEAADIASARRCIRYDELTPASAPGWRGARFEFRPLKAGSVAIAALGLVPGSGAKRVAFEDEQSLAALLRHAAIAIERIDFEQEKAQATAAVEQERLRSALLSSISHDLRTPLATILGSVTSLRELGSSMPAEARDDLLGAIEDETRRLSQFVSNLLAMTRLEAGLDVRRDLVDVGETARAAVERARRAFPHQTFRTELASDLQPVHGDALLLEQVVFNLLDNAARFSPPSRPVDVAVASNGGSAVRLTVTDAGPGVSIENQSRIFEKFFSRGPSGQAAGGVGLGLAICTGAVAAMGGAIEIQSPVVDGIGARFAIRLPAATTKTGATS